jgi:hypothetical protein
VDQDVTVSIKERFIPEDGDNVLNENLVVYQPHHMALRSGASEVNTM